MFALRSALFADNIQGLVLAFVLGFPQSNAEFSTVRVVLQFFNRGHDPSSLD
jgi:hypothetical protein